jgi:hypothetical protein
MIRKLEIDRLSAELASLNSLLAATPASDYLGRIGLESRRNELVEQLSGLHIGEDHQARIALYFWGEPVVGSEGIEAGFASTAVGTFQDFITKLWAVDQGVALASAGPVRDRAASQLHVTHLLHGSLGLLLEELDARGEPLFNSPLKQAADHAAKLMKDFADEDERRFFDAIEDLTPRVFASIKEFFGCMHKGNASFRLVEGDSDLQFDRSAVERAWIRAEESKVEEEQFAVEGYLLGLIPIHRRFELRLLNGTAIHGRVGEEFSHSYLERIFNEKFEGRRWRALLHKKFVERAGRLPIEIYTLLKLEEIGTEER